MSTIEAEIYITIIEAGKEMLLMIKFVSELGLNQLAYAFFSDSQSASHLSKNSMYHSRNKHIDVRYHWLHWAIEDQLHTKGNNNDSLRHMSKREETKIMKPMVRVEGM